MGTEQTHLLKMIAKEKMSGESLAYSVEKIKQNVQKKSKLIENRRENIIVVVVVVVVIIIIIIKWLIQEV